jgi:hypothetical protein
MDQKTFYGFTACLYARKVYFFIRMIPLEIVVDSLKNEA